MQDAARHSTRAALLLLAAVLQAAMGVVSVAITREGFRSWPQGSYTWIPGILGVTALLLAVILYWYLATRGLSFPWLLVAWFAGRVAGAFASIPLTDGLDGSLLSISSFGLLSAEGGRIGLGAPNIGPALPHIAAVALGWRLGAGRRSAMETGGQV